MLPMVWTSSRSVVSESAFLYVSSTPKQNPWVRALSISMFLIGHESFDSRGEIERPLIEFSLRRFSFRPLERHRLADVDFDRIGAKATKGEFRVDERDRHDWTFSRCRDEDRAAARRCCAVDVARALGKDADAFAGS